ncbi:metallophosphoesterase [Planctomycetota bacterium]
MPRLVGVLDLLLKIKFINRRGLRNAANIKVEEVEFVFEDLPRGFNNTRILLITDIHIDCIDMIGDNITRIASEIDYDFCILGGDYTLSWSKDYGDAYSKMEAVACRLRKKSRVFGILGNYDRYSISEVLDRCGVEMLINENVCLEKKDDEIYLVGLDDCSSYETDDLKLADSRIPKDAFKIMVCHSPALYREAAQAGYSLYLAGHTHGGQVCLPGGVVISSGTSAPRKMVKGKWRYGKMVGYTSRGVGTSVVSVRFFCPPEMTIITLRKR